MEVRRVFQTIQVRRYTANEWIASNRILLSGEFGYETDTGKVKIGDGVTSWNSLGYFDQITFIDGNIFEGSGDTIEEIFTIKDYGIDEIKLSESTQQKLNFQIFQERQSNTVVFDKNYIIGNSLPITGNVFFDFTGANLGSKTIMIHDSSIFTLPAESVILSPLQSTTLTNYIEFTLINNSIGNEQVHVIIRQES